MTGDLRKGAEFQMEKTKRESPLWRIWVDTRKKIVSFHEAEDSQLMEFHSHDMFLHCVDEYAAKAYRYQ
jgi:hypothetical protein